MNETAITVPPPCDCSAGFVDVARAIAAAAATNADDAIGLQPTALADVTTPTSIALPCGVFYLTEIDAEAPVTLVVRGRTLLAIGGDVTARAGFTVQLDPSAELDLLVGGQLIVTGGGTFGAAGAAPRFRVWVASATTVLFDGAPAISGVIHAPAAPVTASERPPPLGQPARPLRRDRRGLGPALRPRHPPGGHDLQRARRRPRPLGAPATISSVQRRACRRRRGRWR